MKNPEYRGKPANTGHPDAQLLLWEKARTTDKGHLCAEMVIQSDLQRKEEPAEVRVDTLMCLLRRFHERVFAYTSQK